MNIVIDSSVFLRQNLISGKLINKIFILSNQRIISIYITDIIKKEISSKINYDSLNLENKLNGINKSIKGDLKFVKNIDPEFNIFELINPELINFLTKEKIERFFEYGNIQTIPTPESFDIKEVLNDYFNRRPPFTDKKKSEFPDAISFKIIEKFFKEKNETAFFITHDEDFKELKSNYIEILDNLEDVINKINIDNNPTIKEDSLSIKDEIESNFDLFDVIIENELEFELSHKIQLLFEKKDLFPSISTYKLNYSITEIKVFGIDKEYKEIEFKVIGEFKGNLEVDPEKKDYNFIEYTQLLKDDNLIMDSNLKIKTKGEFEISLFYKYEFPFKIIKDSVSFDEEEYKLKTIINS